MTEPAGAEPQTHLYRHPDGGVSGVAPSHTDQVRGCGGPEGGGREGVGRWFALAPSRGTFW